jgi:peptidoglycan/LPS O-acetylase OafA/YrhL
LAILEIQERTQVLSELMKIFIETVSARNAMNKPVNDSDATGAKRQRLIQLDILRGIAVLMILFNHRPISPPSYQNWSNLLIKPFDPILWTGVDLFFVLSGYLVGGLLIAELRQTGRIDVKRFWIRRGFKIWPTYYLYLAFLAVVTAIFYVDHAVPGSQWVGFKLNAIKAVYLQNYFHASKPPYISVLAGGHTWTLAVEEHFYLMLPLILVACTRWWRVALPVVSFALLVVCLGIRLRSYHAPMDWLWNYKPTHIRIDSLFFGVFLSYLSHERPEIVRWVVRHRLPVGAVGVLLIAPMLWQTLASPFTRTFGFTFLALGYGCLLMVMVATEPGEGVLGCLIGSRLGKLTAWIGFWSYSIYIWHLELSNLTTFLVPFWPGKAGPTVGRLVSWLPWGDVWSLGFVVAAVGLGVLMGRLIERPMLVLRERLYPSRVRSGVARPSDCRLADQPTPAMAVP